MAIHVSVFSAWTRKFVANHRRLMIAIVVVCASSTTYAAESGKARSESHSLAVITHGFRTPGERGSPEWAFTLKDFLEQQGCRCVVTDWAAESNDAARGWAESAGDELFARLAWEGRRPEAPQTLHLIGYSRGAVVNSEAQRRLAWWSERLSSVNVLFDDVNVTLLDPHAANKDSEFSSNSDFLAQTARSFAARTADPAPVLWGNTGTSISYFQRGKVIAPPETPILNPWAGVVETELPSHTVAMRDLTGVEFELNIPRAQTSRLAVTHETLPEWYCEALRSEELPGTAEAFVSGEHGAPLPPETVFNGDFRYDGRVNGLLFRLCAERNRIPGWMGSGRLQITPQHRLRLAVGDGAQSPGVAWVVHNPMFLAPGATTLEWEAICPAERKNVKTRNSDGMLSVYFVPVVLSSSGELTQAADRSTWQMLGTWTTSELPSTDASGRAFSVDLPQSALAATVGALRFELAAFADGSEAAIELDNIQLTSAMRLADGGD